MYAHKVCSPCRLLIRLLLLLLRWMQLSLVLVLFASWLVYSYSAIQSFSYASYFCLKTPRQPPLPAQPSSSSSSTTSIPLQHRTTHSHANLQPIDGETCQEFACKSTYTTRLDSTSVSHRYRYCHRSARSYIPPYRGPICQSVSYRMTYCNTRSCAVPAHANCLRGVLGPTETRTNANYTGLQVSSTFFFLFVMPATVYYAKLCNALEGP